MSRDRIPAGTLGPLGTGPRSAKRILRPADSGLLTAACLGLLRTGVCDAAASIGLPLPASSSLLRQSRRISRFAYDFPPSHRVFSSPGGRPPRDLLFFRGPSHARSNLCLVHRHERSVGRIQGLDPAHNLVVNIEDLSALSLEWWTFSLATSHPTLFQRRFREDSRKGIRQSFGSIICRHLNTGRIVIPHNTTQAHQSAICS